MPDQVQVHAFTDAANNVLHDRAIFAAAFSSIHSGLQWSFFNQIYNGGEHLTSATANMEAAAQAISPVNAPLLRIIKSKAKTASDFQRLTLKWKSERRGSSSTATLAMHPAYQQIIGMGEDAVPLILADLQRGVDHWFWALKAITRENPVPDEDRGNLKKMAAAWLDWGRAKGYAS